LETKAAASTSRWTGKGVSIDSSKVEEEGRFGGKWVLKTNTDFSTETVALNYKELWQVEHTSRDMKCALETRPVYHRRSETIRGHVFRSFLALMLKKELYRRLVARAIALSGRTSPKTSKPSTIQ
jgi:transposase